MAALLPKTVTSLVPSAPLAGMNAGMTPKNAWLGPTSSTVRNGCSVRPEENSARADSMDWIKSSMERRCRTSVSESSSMVVGVG